MFELVKIKRVSFCVDLLDVWGGEGPQREEQPIRLREHGHEQTRARGKDYISTDYRQERPNWFMCNISINRTFLETHRQEKQCFEFPEKMHLADRFIQSDLQ